MTIFKYISKWIFPFIVGAGITIYTGFYEEALFSLGETLFVWGVIIGYDIGLLVIMYRSFKMNFIDE